jgi:predicted O-methyltransferase YrrM
MMAVVAKTKWDAVDDYLTDRLVQPDPLYDQIIERSAAAGLPAISVTATQGKLLQLLAKSIGARQILEIGTLGGYSATWMAKALPADGTVVTIDIEPRHAEVAKNNFKLAGVSDRVEVRIGKALEVLQRLAEQRRQFDFVFIDADKEGYPNYFEWSMKLTRPGGLIVADNVVRDGSVLDERSRDQQVTGIRRFIDAVAASSKVSATAIQTVGSKGWDGLAIIRVE